MQSNFNHSSEGVRSQQRSKRRKTNLILNGLIGLVVILIIIVCVIIFGNDDDKKENVPVQKTEETSTPSDAGNVSKNETKKDTTKNKQNANSDDTEKVDKDSEVVTDGGGDSNVKNTITNPNWKPVGTTQTGPNSSESVDWDERVEALAYAIGTEPANMTVWYLGRDGQDRSIGTVSAKGNPQAYRVYIEWKDGKGWMPTKVEELVANDKAQ